MKASKLTLWLTIGLLAACKSSSGTEDASDTNGNGDSTGSEAGEEEGTDAEAGNDDTTTGGDTTTGATNPGTSSTTGTETDTDTTGPVVINGCEGPWPAGGTLALIDHLEPVAGEESNNSILPEDNRIGYWYTYVDASGTVTPPADSTTPFEPSSEDAQTGSYSAVLSGSGVTEYAGMGLSLNDNCPYDASAFDGISFWAKGDATVTFSIATHETVPSDMDGGSCADDCHNHFAAPAIALTDEWTEYSFTWDELAQGSGWGTPATFSSAEISKLQWQVSGSAAGLEFKIMVDNVSFTPRGPEDLPDPIEGDTDGDTDGVDTDDGADTDDGVDTDDAADTDTDGAGA